MHNLIFDSLKKHLKSETKNFEIIVARVYNCFDNVYNHTSSIPLNKKTKSVFLHSVGTFLHYTNQVNTNTNNNTG